MLHATKDHKEVDNKVQVSQGLGLGFIWLRCGVHGVQGVWLLGFVLSRSRRVGCIVIMGLKGFMLRS